MMHTDLPGNDDACYLALRTRDARFDGSFFTGVTSTGIYCRPVCRARTPKRENCRFFAHAAQAESAGFRPCLRCRPEFAPHAASWSIHDAASILAQQASRWLDEPEAWGDEPPSVANLAARMGVSDRHLRRIFQAQFGISPLQYLQTSRLLSAKQLLTDSDLPVTQIALMSGYSSVRRFNAAFLEHYGLNPSRLRHEGTAGPATGRAIRLGYRPPYDINALLGFLHTRQVQGLEAVDLQRQRIGRTLRIESGGRQHTGWLMAEFDPDHCQLALRVSDSLHGVLPLVLRRVRAAFDLDADPHAIDRALCDSFPGTEGRRVPGALDGFELAVRAVLGQQITVAAARTLTQRLVERFGEPLSTPWPGLSRLFPAPGQLAHASPGLLGELGIVRQRQTAIVALARAITDRHLSLQGSTDVPATLAALKQIPGIGDWTAQYIAMRALRWPDAFPAGDVALHKALGVQDAKQPARAAEAASQAWRPWRSYAVIRAWSAPPRSTPAR